MKKNSMHSRKRSAISSKREQSLGEWKSISTAGKEKQHKQPVKKSIQTAGEWKSISAAGKENQHQQPANKN
ncbi:MAG: hypothetical protein K5870_10620 [Lachnospiraceae bacterium]|nr:hypothetical protein [Lachnospiraceae bacterium]